MITISEKLKQIESAKNSIKAAIIAKGGSFDGISSFADYSRSSQSSPPTNSSLIINGQQLLDNTIRNGQDSHTFTLEVPANSTVSWSATPFYFRNLTPTSLTEKYIEVLGWKTSTGGFGDTSGSFSVTDGDYGIVLTPINLSSIHQNQ